VRLPYGENFIILPWPFLADLPVCRTDRRTLGRTGDACDSIQGDEKRKRQTLSISSPNIDQFSKKFSQAQSVKNLFVYHYHTLTASLWNINFRKSRIIRINTCAKSYLIKQLFTNCLFKLNYVVCKRLYCRRGWAQKLSSKLLFTSSPNIDLMDFIDLYFTQQ